MEEIIQAPMFTLFCVALAGFVAVASYVIGEYIYRKILK